MARSVPRCLNVLLLGLVGCLAMHSAGAIELETLVMPDKVIAGHAKFETDCSACHARFDRGRQDSLCVDCHQEAGADRAANKGFHGRHPEALSESCASCHTEHEGRDANIILFSPTDFDHVHTDFELLGLHQDVDCEDCHAPPDLYREAPRECITCHVEDDVHAGGLGEDCASCHVARGWDVVEFAHELETDFALLGGHASIECDACHINSSYAETPTQCVACHRADDVHKGHNGDDCAACHSEVNWTDSSFDHSLVKAFPLLGRHVEVACESCHVEPVHTVSPGTRCVDCHGQDDPHEGNLGESCNNCHNERDWADSSFDHSLVKAFPLLGSHVDVACESCHVEPAHTVSPGTGCVDCHGQDDPHEGQLGESCNDCHNETDWTTNIRFDHGFTRFPLIGTHRDAECDTCHESMRFEDAPTACIDCHSDEDVHEGGLGTDCGACHNPADWSRWRFDHFVDNGFELDGAHSELVCADCHRKPPRQGATTPSRCVDCHRRDDVHDGGFGANCSRCHSTSSFREAIGP